MNRNYGIQTIDENSPQLLEALQLVIDVFLEFEAPDYCDEGIMEFKNYIESDAIIKMLRKNEIFIWGCINEKKVIGVIATKQPCHISLLFVDKLYHKQGIARELYNTVVSYYMEKSNYTEMTVNSSPYAVEVYHKLGFTDTNNEQTVNGIRFIPMKCIFR